MSIVTRVDTLTGTGRSFEAALVPAPGVARIPHLEAFLPECARLVRRPLPAPEVDAVIGWGLKPTSRHARQIAASRGLPYLALEDGFLRSVGLGELGAPPVSLIADDLGVYYDATRPSRLEYILNSTGWETPELLARARAAMARIRETGLSKTNLPAPTRSLGPAGGRRRVLVVDQTAGDASIAYGLADGESFSRMWRAAEADAPGAELLLKRHPAVAAGVKQGCVPDAIVGDAPVLAGGWSATALLDEVDEVYVVSSLLGFEALIRGLPVRCFGAPFYAGWGLTRDEVAVPRRARTRTLEELFAAAYLLYARYVDPVTGQPCELEQAMDRLLLFRQRAREGAGFTACVGFAPWKHGPARKLLYSPSGEVKFFSDPAVARREAEARDGRVVYWAARETPALTAALDGATVPVTRMEDGFIRSRGLGSRFHGAASVVLDDLGIYYDPTRPSRLERILETAEFDDALRARAAALRVSVVAGGLSKYNLGGRASETDAWPAGRFKLLVVGQVENDKSILRGCEDVRTNAGLLAAARATHPDAFLIYKEHPDVVAGNRPGGLSPEARALADAHVEAADISACLTASDGLATMTSLAGFEALMRGKPVWTWGRPFYAGWGLTNDALTIERRSRRLTPDELVAGALILYPIYIDPVTGLPCEPEDMVAAMARALRSEVGPEGFWSRRSRYIKAVIESLRRSPKLSY